MRVTASALFALREPSWAAVRDKLLGGALDAAQMLYGLVYGVELGIGGPRRDMAVLMTLNQNGGAITLGNSLRALGVTSGAELAGYLEHSGEDAHFSEYLSDRHPRAVVVLLAGGARHRSAARRAHLDRAAHADGRTPRRGQHRRLLRR